QAAAVKRHLKKISRDVSSRRGVGHRRKKSTT
ncbi:TPA: 30S ribosomal protein S21, partial [Legionella pneumophila]|nr:30S ribosomal protein S21 [Legionella pneumophila]